jgi:hypothetical protein
MALYGITKLHFFSTGKKKKINVLLPSIMASFSKLVVQGSASSQASAEYIPPKQKIILNSKLTDENNVDKEAVNMMLMKKYLLTLKILAWMKRGAG